MSSFRLNFRLAGGGFNRSTRVNFPSPGFNCCSRIRLTSVKSPFLQLKLQTGIKCSFESDHVDINITESNLIDLPGSGDNVPTNVCLTDLPGSGGSDPKYRLSYPTLSYFFTEFTMWTTVATIVLSLCGFTACCYRVGPLPAAIQFLESYKIADDEEKKLITAVRSAIQEEIKSAFKEQAKEEKK